MQDCFIYCRVSTEEQADKGYSLDTQEKLCRDFAERNDYRVAGVYRDEGKSGTTLERPALTELLSRCTKDGSLNAVIVQETDRLARNTKDHLTIRALLQKAGVRLISVAQPMLDDSPEGNMIDTILASVNQFQSDINARKTKRGLKERFDRGWWPGEAPLGYINMTIEANGDADRPSKIIVKDPRRWELLREGFQLYLTSDYSVEEVNDILYEKGLRSRNGKKIVHSVIAHALRNSFYAGIMKWGGHQYPGKHESIITMKEHKQVLEVIDVHNQHACRRRKHSFLLRGFVFCGICGRRYTAEIHPAKKKAYYHCKSVGAHSNRGQNVEVAILDHEVEKRFRTIQFSEGFSRLIVDKLRAVYLEQRQSINSKKQILYNRKKAVEAKRDRAEEKLLDGVLSDDDFVRLRAKFTDELARIEEQVEQLDDRKELDMDVIQNVLELSRNICSAYKNAHPALKRQYLGLFWDRFFVQDKKIVEAVPTDLVRLLQKEKQVIITSDWQPSPKFILTLLDVKYMRELERKVEEVTLSLAGADG